MEIKSDNLLSKKRRYEVALGKPVSVSPVTSRLAKINLATERHTNVLAPVVPEKYSAATLTYRHAAKGSLSYFDRAPCPYVTFLHYIECRVLIHDKQLGCCELFDTWLTRFSSCIDSDRATVVDDESTPLVPYKCYPCRRGAVCALKHDCTASYRCSNCNRVTPCYR